MRLTPEDLRRINAAIRDKDTSRTIRCRAQILKLADEGRLTQQQIAKQIGVSPSTVSLAVRQYCVEGIDSVLHFRHNPASDDAKRKIDSAAEARIVALACSTPPAGYSRWTYSLLAERCSKMLGFSVGRTTIGTILKRHALQPHRSKYWCRAPGPDDDPDKQRPWDEAMDNVLTVYAKPYDPEHPVICLDEKTLQLLGEVRAPLETIPGNALRIDAEYSRKGTAALFVITEPATGRCAVSTRPRRTARDFAEVLAYVSDVLYPNAETITIVLDNLNTHTAKSLEKRYSADKAQRIASRIRLVFTPVHGSWLNLAENQISIISRQCLTRRIPDLQTLRTKMRSWVRHRNETPTPVHWKFSKEDARRQMPHLYVAGSAA